MASGATSNEYALRVCPFLAIPKAHYADIERRPPAVGHLVVMEEMSTERPAKFMLGTAPSYQPAKIGDSFVIQADAWTDLRWWQDGVEL